MSVVYSKSPLTRRSNAQELNRTAKTRRCSFLVQPAVELQWIIESCLVITDTIFTGIIYLCENVSRSSRLSTEARRCSAKARRSSAESRRCATESRRRTTEPRRCTAQTWCCSFAQLEVVTENIIQMDAVDELTFDEFVRISWSGLNAGAAD